MKGETVFILGPAVCMGCKAHVYLDTAARWCDGDGLRHACSKPRGWLSVRRWPRYIYGKAA